jgi:hypothetical protein
MKIDPVTFEQIMSFRPRPTVTSRKQPTLRDLIYEHYMVFHDAERSNQRTKEYIAALYAQFGEPS